LLNAAVGLWTTYILEDHMRRVRALRARCALVMALLVAGLVYASEFTRLAETGLYSNEIVLAEQSAYQRIVITHSARGFQLFLDGNLQFASHDEYRYHEALVHPAFAATQVHARVLVLGGGDGLALREILSYPDVREVTLVDLDPSMTRLGRSFPLLRAQNRAAFEDPRVHVVRPCNRLQQQGEFRRPLLAQSLDGAERVDAGTFGQQPAERRREVRPALQRRVDRRPGQRDVAGRGHVFPSGNKDLGETRQHRALGLRQRRGRLRHDPAPRVAIR